MEKIEFKNLPDKSTPLSAEMLNLMQDNIETGIEESVSPGAYIGAEEPSDDKINLWVNPEEPMNYVGSEVVNSLSGNDTDKAPSIKSIKDTLFQIGSLYTSITNENPSSKLGGTWELLKQCSGGELLCYGCCYNGSTNSTAVASGASISFADSKIPNKVYKIENYVDGIIEGVDGTLKIHTKGIVGMVEATVSMTGNGACDFWWGSNANELPSGVEFWPLNSNLGITPGPKNNGYGGSSNTIMYKVNTTNNVEFYVNPNVMSYNGSFTPANGGTKCFLMIKVYAKYGNSYVWKRTA